MNFHHLDFIPNFTGNVNSNRLIAFSRKKNAIQAGKLFLIIFERALSFKDRINSDLKIYTRYGLRAVVLKIELKFSFLMPIAEAAALVMAG